MQERMTPEAMRLRRSTVEHPFATIKYRIFGHASVDARVVWCKGRDRSRDDGVQPQARHRRARRGKTDGNAASRLIQRSAEGHDLNPESMYESSCVPPLPSPDLSFVTTSVAAATPILHGGVEVIDVLASRLDQDPA
jgi:hypothetical protein